MIKMKILKRAEAKLRNVNGEYYLIPLTSEVAEISKIFKLNYIGMKIWNYIENDNQHSIDEILGLLSEEFEEIDNSILMQDVQEFLEKLICYKIIEVE